MIFLTFVTRGLTRRPVRTGLTIVGIAIGIAAVVTLVGISRGFETSWATVMKSRGTDIVVSNMGRGLTPRPFSASVVDRMAPLPHIAETCSLLVDLISVEKAEMMIVSARQWGGFSWKHLKLVSGRLPHNDKERAVVLGKTAAEVLEKKVGDVIQLETEELPVVGVVDGGAVVEDGSIILSLSLLQEITGNQGNINIIDVRVTPATTPAELKGLCEQITRLVPEARAVVAGEHIRDSQAYRMIRAMSWGTSLLAVLVGVLGVMNTMLMSRIVRMVLWESAVLGFLGGVGGVLFGVIGVKLLVTTPAIRGLLEPDLNPKLLILAVLIAVMVGIFSGIYPAWRSSRLTPSHALHG